MSDASTSTEPSTCGCCDPGVADPAEVANRAGLAALSYRIGTHPTFLRHMLAALPGAPYPRDPNDDGHPLRTLTTRSDGDPAIALLDAWATVSDIVSFYQERIANEGFLRTATELRSVLELAREIGYELRPGLAASAYLAFTVETAAGAPESAVVKTGTKVKSVPAQDKVPQTFETVEDITARAEWNEMRVQATLPPAIAPRHVYLSGVTTGLQPGDGILVVGDERKDEHGNEQWDFRVLQTVTTTPPGGPGDPGSTLVTWTEALGHHTYPRVDPAEKNPRVYAFRLRASLFGHNAPDWRTMPESVQAQYEETHPVGGKASKKAGRAVAGTVTEWPGFALPTDGSAIDLDAVYARILPGDWLVFHVPTYTELYGVTEVTTGSRTDFALTAKTTRFVPDTTESLDRFDLRSTTVYGQSEDLGLAAVPLATPLAGRDITLVRAVDGLQPGQRVMVSGLPMGADPGAPRHSEAGTIQLVTPNDAGTLIHLVDPLTLEGGYDPATVTVCANVALATHGESVDEVLGGGDGSATFQRFSTKKNPVTYVPALTTSGAKSTMTVRVNGVRWDESPSLYGLDPRSQRYIVRIDDQQRASVQFGDGLSGARLPSGQENVTAHYRSGLGPDGNVGAESLTLLQIRPLGIRRVTNPLPAAGGTASESLSDARTNAPLTVLTLDRIVSISDYEDFARAFSGIAKAQAISIWTGERFLVHVTVAGPDGAAIDPAATKNLLGSMDLARDPVQQVRAASYRELRFRVGAQVLVDAAYVSRDVFDAVLAALQADFGFDARGFAQPVTAAEVITTIQGVAGVVACDLTALYDFDPSNPPPPDFTPPPPAMVLGAERAQWVGAGSVPPVMPAQLLLIDPTGNVIEEMAP